MKECPNCKSMLEDDELFCHECGAKQEIESVANQNEEAATPLERKCIHCGETIDEDSAFCPYCGRSQVMEEVKGPEPEEEKEPVLEEKLEFKQEEKPTPEEKEELKEPPVQETPEEQITYQWEDEKKSKKWIWILLMVLLAGAGAWYFFSQNGYSLDGEETAAEAVDSDTIAVVPEEDEMAPTSARGFLEEFYKGEYGDDGFIKQNVTANVLNKLKRDYDYDCPSNDCLAVWVFTAYPAGADMEMEEGPIISETDVEGRYKVEFKYSGYDGEQKEYHIRTVYLTVSKVDDKYLISDYELFNIIGIDDNMEEADQQDPILSDGIVKMAGSVSSYKIHMVLEVNNYHITGYYYYDSQSSDNRVRLIGDIREDKSLRLKKYNEQGEETGYFDGTFDGSTFFGSNINYNRDGSLPFSVERID